MKKYDKNMVENIYNNIEVSYTEMLNFLQGEDFEEKHFALTFIKELKKPEDIFLLINNIVGQDTKIRELASFRTCDFILENPSLMQLFDQEEEIILRAIDDVNPQVCRNVCTILRLSGNKHALIQKIIQKIKFLLEKTKAIRFKTHKVNKEIFHLYWNLFALENLVDEDFSEIEDIIDILENGAVYKDYTIRERVAFLAKALPQNSKHIISTLENDENFYVRKAVLV